MSSLLIALHEIHAIWPAAERVRFEGKCPVCKEQGLYSYILPEFDRIRGELEDCGFYCTACNWGNAGSRRVESGVR